MSSIHEGVSDGGPYRHLYGSLGKKSEIETERKSADAYPRQEVLAEQA